MKNKNTTYDTTSSPANLRKLTAPDLWDRLTKQQAILAGDAAFIARLRAEGPLSGADPGPLLLEYLRFAYLAWTMPGGATPSKAVDEVWHAHILFTRSYARFCRDTRGETLHHDPGGGEADEAKFRDAYRRTLDRYEAEFGPPPPRYWPRPAVPKIPTSEPPAQPAKKRETPAGVVFLSGGLASLAAAALVLTLTGSPYPTAIVALIGIYLSLLVSEATPAAAAPVKSGGKASAKGSTSSSCGGDAGPISAATTAGCADGGSAGSCGDGGGSSSSCGSSCGGGGCGGG